jgi:hypothetical protein
MKRWSFAAALLAAFSVKASAAQFKSSTFEQASDLAAGQTAPAVYDGARSLPVFEQMGMNQAQDAARSAPAPAPQAVAAAPARVSTPRIYDVPMPQGMEIASLPREAAPAKPGASRDLAAPLGALIGLSAGLGIGLGLSKALA